MKPIVHIPLEKLDYETAYQRQIEHHTQILESRETHDPQIARIMMIEHPPLITVTRRPNAPAHILSSEIQLAQHGIALHQTDRGGDVTYHGPGQLVSYPIVDLSALKLRIHDYIRILEHAVIDTLAHYDIHAHTDPSATGVWIDPTHNPQHHFDSDQPAKICAIGVRVRRWITLHGLALNLNPNMDHYTHIVPCGLTNRPVISMSQILTESNIPTMNQLADVLYDNLALRLTQKHATT